jgi:hypothetical protein
MPDKITCLGRFCRDHPGAASLWVLMFALWPVVTFAVTPCLPPGDFLTADSLNEGTRTVTLALVLGLYIGPKVVKAIRDGLERLHRDLREDAAQQAAAALDAIRQDIDAVGDHVLAAVYGSPERDVLAPEARQAEDRSRRRLRVAPHDDRRGGNLGTHPVGLPWPVV